MADKLKAHTGQGAGRIVGRQSLASPAALSATEYHELKQIGTERKAASVFTDRRRVAGTIAGQCFFKKVDKNRHFFRKFGGYAISTQVLHQLAQAGIQEIVLTEIYGCEPAIHYRTQLSTFICRGIPTGTRQDTQLCLPLKFWQLIKDDSQLSLFGGDGE